MDDLYKPSNKIVENAHINKSKYEEMYKESISNPIKFWSEHGKRIDWIKNYEKVRDFSYILSSFVTNIPPSPVQIVLVP